jgi:hypothetical protein
VTLRIGAQISGIVDHIADALDHLSASLRRSRPSPPAQIGRPHQFFMGGVQHYVAGRHALICGYEASASLFHQGFELLLKADLLEPVYQRHAGGWAHGTVQQKGAAVQRYNEEAERLLRRRIGHDLWRAWASCQGCPRSCCQSGSTRSGRPSAEPVVAATLPGFSDFAFPDDSAEHRENTTAGTDCWASNRHLRPVSGGHGRAVRDYRASELVGARDSNGCGRPSTGTEHGPGRLFA